MKAMTASRRSGFLGRHALDFLFGVFLLMSVLVVLNVLGTARRTTAIQEAQVAAIRQQNAVAMEQQRQALCNQHDLIVAVKLIGDRLNILKTDDIVIPDISGLDCP